MDGRADGQTDGQWTDGWLAGSVLFRGRERSSLTHIFLHHKPNNYKDKGVHFSSSLVLNCKSLKLGFSIKTPFKSPLGFVGKTNGNFIF